MITKAFRVVMALITLSAALSLPACSYITGAGTFTSPQEITNAGLNDTQWKLTALEGAPPLENTYIYLQFHTDGTIWANIGVNYIDAEYRITKDYGMHITMMGVTMIGSLLPPVSEQEKKIMHELGAVTGYEIDGKKLTLTNASGAARLILDQLPEYAMNPSNLDYTSWRLIMINGVQIPTEIDVKLEFTGNRQAFCYAGKYSAQLGYAARGDDLLVQSMRVTDTKNLIALYKSERAHIEYSAYLSLVVNYCLYPDKLEFFTLRGDTLTFEKE